MSEKYVEAVGVLEENPKTGWSDTDIFEVNYPDNIQVQIDRMEDGCVRLVLWKIGDSIPLFDYNVYLEEDADEEAEPVSVCSDCGEEWKTKGHMDCQYPQN